MWRRGFVEADQSSAAAEVRIRENLAGRVASVETHVGEVAFAAYRETATTGALNSISASEED